MIASHRFPIRVYYEDTDAGGVVYHANYLRFAERARTEFLRDLGHDHGRLAREEGLHFVVRACAVDFRRPARLDDALTVVTEVARIAGARLDLAQSVMPADGGPALVEMTIRLACADGAGKPRRLPRGLARLMNERRHEQETV